MHAEGRGGDSWPSSMKAGRGHGPARRLSSTHHRLTRHIRNASKSKRKNRGAAAVRLANAILHKPNGVNKNSSSPHSASPPVRPFSIRQPIVYIIFFPGCVVEFSVFFFGVMVVLPLCVILNAEFGSWLALCAF